MSLLFNLPASTFPTFKLLCVNNWTIVWYYRRISCKLHLQKLYVHKLNSNLKGNKILNLNSCSPLQILFDLGCMLAVEAVQLFVELGIPLVDEVHIRIVVVDPPARVLLAALYLLLQVCYHFVNSTWSVLRPRMQSGVCSTVEGVTEFLLLALVLFQIASRHTLDNRLYCLAV